jgi:hypothetical protein
MSPDSDRKEDPDLIEFYLRYKEILPDPINYPGVYKYYWDIFHHSKKVKENGQSR